MVSICEIDDCGKPSVGQFKRTKHQAKEWPDKNMPIDLCAKHCIGRSRVEGEIFIIDNNVYIKVKTA